MIYLSIFIIYVVTISFLSWLVNRPKYKNTPLKFSELKLKPRPLTEHDKLYGQGSELARICNNLKKKYSTDNIRVYPISKPTREVEFDGESFELKKSDGTTEMINPDRITGYPGGYLVMKSNPETAKKLRSERFKQVSGLDWLDEMDMIPSLIEERKPVSTLIEDWVKSTRNNPKVFKKGVSDGVTTHALISEINKNAIKAGVQCEKTEQHMEYMKEFCKSDLGVPFSMISTYADGEACSQGCLSHVTHPCEKCGRINGISNFKPEFADRYSGKPFKPKD